MGIVSNFGLAALAATVLAAPALATSQVNVVDGHCISVSNAHGCLFTGNIAPNTITETQTSYNTYNNTHPSANPDITLNFLFKSDDGAGFHGSITGGNGTSGTWSTPGFLVDFIAVKASNAFVLYKLATPTSSGVWNTYDIPYLNSKGKGNPHELSHLAFFGEAIGDVLPEPGAWAMLIAGFGLVGGALRRRNSDLASVAA